MRSVRKKKEILLIFILLFATLGLFLEFFSKSIAKDSYAINKNYNNIVENYREKNDLFISDNRNDLESIFDQKIFDNSTYGYFQQLFEPSLQATYYAIYALKCLNRLDKVNVDSIANYVISHYNSTTHAFTDLYSNRYLDSDFRDEYFNYKTFYPLTSLLQTTCYAILTFKLLDKLHLIDSNDCLNYIWSCYQNDSSGFIGRPYDSTLLNFFNVSTLDNTYYAVLTIDQLEGWNNRLVEKENITKYINSLQSFNAWQYGAFPNDNNTEFLSLGTPNDPNILSSYFAIKTLEVLETSDTLNIDAFKTYLSNLYNPYSYYFKYRTDQSTDKNVISTVYGIELSKIIGFTGYNEQESFSFVMRNRNNMGSWEQSSIYGKHELIDTFDVIRFLNSTNQISKLNSNEINNVSNAILNFTTYTSFSLLSHDYTTTTLINRIVNAFYYNISVDHTISDLNSTKIYNILKQRTVYPSTYPSVLECSETSSLLKNMSGNALIFRSYPIELNTDGQKNFQFSEDRYRSIETIFYTLDTLLKLSKLNAYFSNYDYNNFVSEIIGCQFLNDTFVNENYGGFFSKAWYSSDIFPDLIKNSLVFFKYSYFAIKILDLIASYKDLGSIASLGVDTNALYSYVLRHRIETSSLLCYKFEYSSSIEDILEATYYMIYILKTIDKYSLNNVKIKNYILQNLNYSDVKNVYYSFKISNILGLNISFDLSLTHTLFENVFSSTCKEYYTTKERKTINQEAFWWACDLIYTDGIRIKSTTNKKILLGDYLKINVTLCNIVLNEFRPTITLRFESDQIGYISFLYNSEKNMYYLEHLISVSPANYPILNGSIVVYDVDVKKVEQFEQVNTYYNLTVLESIAKESSQISFRINISFETANGPQVCPLSRVYVITYKNYICIGEINFNFQDYPIEKTTLFELIYAIDLQGNYFFNIYIENDYEPKGLYLFNYSYNAPAIVIFKEDEEENAPNELLIISKVQIIALFLFLSVPISIVALSKLYLKKMKVKNSV